MVKVLVLDILFLHKFLNSTRNIILVTLFYIFLAACFGVGLLLYDTQSGIEFFTGFIIEKTLSLDNIFVIKMIFDYFQINKNKQHSVLFIGIISAMFFRAIMIWSGALIIAEYHWVLYIFAAILIASGIKMLYAGSKEHNQQHNLFAINFLEKYIKIVPNTSVFFVKTEKGWRATRLFLALLCIEFMDLVFAIDSVPAIFAVTQNTMVIYTSNIFAILGLRALFGLVNELDKNFYYIKHSMAFILCFVGIKILASHYIDISAWISLLITFTAIACGILASVTYKTKAVK
jgi:tellurite resistance protein TerC